MNNEINGVEANGTHRWRLAGWSAALVLLLVPLVAMQFTAEVNWSLADFGVAAAMLIGAGLLLELVVRMKPGRSYRWGAVVAVASAFLMMWLTGAVGIIGSENHAANLLYPAMLLVMAVLALVTRFRAHGMAVAMLAGALMQGGIALAAAIAGWGELLHAMVLNGCFIALWLCAAGLFRRAADQPRAPMSADPGD